MSSFNFIGERCFLLLGGGALEHMQSKKQSYKKKKMSSEQRGLASAQAYRSVTPGSHTHFR